ncbi:hypothetical protein [Bradyrhizobium sp. B117]|uniref:hypothetical protein n=1 Tax=Bradyrhizobium sp. B117 TaxID=3140246 RepID=UPI003183B474
MSTHVCGWRIELINAYRNLFRPPPRAPILAQGYPECGPGWRDLIERACGRITAMLGPEERLEILQIKEKYGTVRVYWRGKLSEHSRQTVEGILALAEARSGTTCEQCGGKGRLYRAGGVLMTRCPAHAKGQSVPIRAGLENVYIVQKVVDGRLSVTCRRYDRDTDSFIDVGRLSSGIENW